MKITRVIIVHGYNDSENNIWISWLRKELEKQNIEVIIPKLPNPKLPKLSDWAKAINKCIGTLDETTALVGHSLGTYSLLQVLSSDQLTGQCSKLVLIAGFASSPKKGIEKYFLPLPNFDTVKQKAEQIYHIFSDDDRSVSPALSKKLAQKVGGESFELPNKGHFVAGRDVVDFPLVLDIINNY